MAKKIRELPCGAKIKFGAYSVEGEGAHKLKWIKTQPNDTIFITEYIEDFRAFDTREPDNPVNSIARNGNGDYTVSNIDSFLNCKDETWYTPRHEYDQSPAYHVHQGFLAHFYSWEIDAIKEREIVIAEAHTEKEVISRKVFLPSITEITGRRNGEIEEGQHWQYFKESTRAARPTKQSTTRSDAPVCNPVEYWYYWLRSHRQNEVAYVYYIDTSGSYSYVSAREHSVGIRPALEINPETLISNEPDEEGYYEVLQKDSDECEIPENDLFALLRNKETN